MNTESLICPKCKQHYQDSTATECPSCDYSFTITQKLSAVDYLKRALERRWQYEGRASRSEYWWVALANFILFIAVLTPILILRLFKLKFLGDISGLIIPVFLIASAILLLPLLVRRIRDAGLPWGIVFVGLVPHLGMLFLIVVCCLPSVKLNKSGPPAVDDQLGHGDSRDGSKEVERYKLAAPKGRTAQAQNNPEFSGAQGRGIAKDKSEYVEWYTKLAFQGNAEAQYILGDCYEHGRGVCQNEKKAVELYEDAAKQGYIDAQFALGRCYTGGEGVEVNLEEGYKWWGLAADQGNAPAQVIIGLRFLDGLGVDQDKQRGARLLNSAAKQGNAEALYYLGHCYHTGSGVAVNKLKAEQLWRSSADLGNIEAKEALSRKASYVEQDKECRESAREISKEIS